MNLSEPAERVRSYVQEMKLTFPILLDATGAAAREYGVRFTPTHFLIDRHGIVRAGGSGGKDWKSRSAHGAIRALLEAPPGGSKIPARQERAESPSVRRAERR